MTVYVVGMRIEADDGDAVIARIGEWILGENEGIVSVQAQPEMVQIPPELMPPPLSAMPPPLPEAEAAEKKTEKK